MDLQTLHAEAEECRKNAKCYVGKPEASFLLRLAEAFEQLRAQQDETNKHPVLRALSEGQSLEWLSTILLRRRSGELK
jgi:hypothetical protein